MDKKVNINDAVYGLCEYKGAVTIEYYVDFNHKKYINKYNEGNTALFSNIVRFLRGEDSKNLNRPTRIQLFYKLDSSDKRENLTTPIAINTTPSLYTATSNTDGTYIYTLATNSSEANCIMLSFIITKGSYFLTGTDISVDSAQLQSDDGTVFATITFADNEFKVNSETNMQIFWRLIFENK